eukprot:1904351-Lingulodinium_polyedra.AAC.1
MPLGWPRFCPVREFCPVQAVVGGLVLRPGDGCRVRVQGPKARYFGCACFGNRACCFRADAQ